MNGTNEVGRNEAREKRLPQAIIIGAKKSGTRALARFLELNSAVRAARREVHFFDREKNYKLGLNWYRGQMPETEQHTVTIEKSPAYFVTQKVPERIREMNISIKLILILRDPVTRLISDFSQLVANRIEASLDNFEGENDESEDESGDSSIALASVNNVTALWQKAEKEFEKHVFRKDGRIDEQRKIVKTGMYALYLEKWFASFPREQMHFVDGERLIKKPHVELQKLEIFLGFKKPSIQKEHFVFSPRKGFYCITNEISFNTKLAVQDRMLAGPICLGKSKGRRHVKVSQETITKLKNFYAPYNDYLFSMTGLYFH